MKLGVTAPTPKMKPIALVDNDMKAIGDLAISLLKKRVAAGLKPLTPKYAIYKQKHGEDPIRNLSQSGDMLSELTTDSPQSNSVAVTFGSQLALIKAAVNEARSPFFYPTPADQDELRSAIDIKLSK